MVDHEMPDGGVITYPEISGRDFLDASPLTFVHHLIAANPELSIKFVSLENIKFTLQAMLASKEHDFSSFLDSGAQYQVMLRRWESSPDWGTLRFILEGHTEEVSTQGSIPSPLARTGSNIFLFGKTWFFLPSDLDKKFEVQSFRIDEFINELMVNNHPQQEHLSVDVVKAAVEQYASRRYRFANPGVVGIITAQLESPEGVRALDNHSTWLTRARQPRIQPLASIPNPLPEVPRTSNKIYLMSDAYRAGLLSRRRSLQVSLRPDALHGVPSRTHLHYVGVTSGAVGHLPSRKLRIVPSYDLAVVVEYESPKQRGRGIGKLNSVRHCFASGNMKAVIAAFQDTTSNNSPKWTYLRLPSYSDTAVQEKLSEFFCLEGDVDKKFLSSDHVGPRFGEKRLRLAGELPGWMQKLVAEGTESNAGYIEIRVAEECELCRPSDAVHLARVSLPVSKGARKRANRRQRRMKAVPEPRFYNYEFGRLRPPIEPASTPNKHLQNTATAERESDKENRQVSKYDLKSTERFQIPTNSPLANITNITSSKSLLRHEEPIAQAKSDAKRKMEAVPIFDTGNVQVKKQKVDEASFENTVIKREKFNKEGDSFLESMQKDLDVMKNRRLLLIKAQDDLKSSYSLEPSN